MPPPHVSAWRWRQRSTLAFRAKSLVSPFSEVVSISFQFQVREGVDQMEKGAIIGMVGLALSDLCFCFVTICEAFMPQKQMIYRSKTATYALTISREFVQNTLIKTSTCFTVIMAVSRHVAVCYPMRARQYMRPCHTSIAMALSFLFWTLLHIPMLWTWETEDIQCSPDVTITLLDVGVFVTDRTLRIVFTYIWALLGFFVPVVILAYCNWKLIQSLRLSRKLRTNNSKRSSSLKSKQDNQRRISVTLMAIVVMFFVTVCPSEILHFLVDAVYNGDFQHTRLLLITNLLQVVNFSANFALYCVVNSYFRKVLRRIPPCEWDKDKRKLVLKKNQWGFRRNERKRSSVSLMTRSFVMRDSGTCVPGKNLACQNDPCTDDHLSKMWPLIWSFTFHVWTTRHSGTCCPQSPKMVSGVSTQKQWYPLNSNLLKVIP